MEVGLHDRLLGTPDDGADKYTALDLESLRIYSSTGPHINRPETKLQGLRPTPGPVI
jgi:hypothetical protein